ncbi:DUF6343 family protein [Nonomuraea gerenzanensis]|uniref:Uncharacterized protein n=1 Tax=Nonomuraea gerenzanensis TaxID=93944 RepID=A0A1M4E1R5_9ACTN|nr:DUF6343 family protein [Nonomuraea gerenzanensis]UBU15037.1 DUF6343 family protein [Nonomuraea gerenzanensis]SBO92780.1 hypothetical protein BN4615_P2294 [Nonomuraea gerenzanensis]
MWLRNREGTEPVTARSPLRARRVLSIVALVFGVVAAVFCTVQAMRTGEEVWRWEAAIAALVALCAAASLVVLRHHRSGGQHGQQQ